MLQDFRHAQLSGQSFKGQDLAGADFSHADIRQVDFTDTILVGANFSYARAGLRPRWALGWLIIAFSLSVVAGLDSAYGGASIGIMLVHQGMEELDFSFSLLALLLLIVFGFTVTQRGWGTETGVLAIILAAISAFVAAVGTSEAIANAVVQAVAIAGTVAGFVTGALATAITKMIAGKNTSIGAIGASFLGAVIGASLGIPRSSTEVIVSGFIGASITTLALIVMSVYGANRALISDQRYALIRSMAIALCSSKGTSFRNANLTNANFMQAILKHTDFRGAVLTRTNWFQSQGLDQSRVEETYLDQFSICHLVTTKNGRNTSFDRCNLREINLQDADLTDSSFIGADLSEATLKNANLSRAKLVQAQLYQTDLTNVCLTGAYIQDWSISTDTNLHAVRCDYIYMHLPTTNDPDPWRKPDNRQETFKEGDFSDFIAPIVKTLDLYQRQNVDPRHLANTFKILDLYHYEGIDPSAAAVTLKQLAEEHPEAELEIVALEGRREEKVRLQAKVTNIVDQSQLNAEYFKKYRENSSLPYKDLQAILAGMAEKDERIRSLEKMVITAIESNKSYIETNYIMGDNMPEQSSINIQADGNVSGVTGGDASGILNLGSISGNVTNAINQIPSSPAPEQLGIKELLTQLKAAIELEAELSLEDKADLLEQVQSLAEAKQAPNQQEKEGLARKAKKMFEATLKSLPDTAKIVEASSKLLPLILKALGLSI